MNSKGCRQYRGYTCRQTECKMFRNGGKNENTGCRENEGI